MGFSMDWAHSPLLCSSFKWVELLLLPRACFSGELWGQGGRKVLKALPCFKPARAGSQSLAPEREKEPHREPEAYRKGRPGMGLSQKGSQAGQGLRPELWQNHLSHVTQGALGGNQA